LSFFPDADVCESVWRHVGAREAFFAKVEGAIYGETLDTLYETWASELTLQRE
jgi:hypothetical protein